MSLRKKDWIRDTRCLRTLLSISLVYKKDGVYSDVLEQQMIAEDCKNVCLTSFWYHPKSDTYKTKENILFSCKIARAIQ